MNEATAKNKYQKKQAHIYNVHLFAVTTVVLI